MASAFPQKSPANAKPGECYVKCFDFDKKIEWKEVDCSEVKKGITIVRDVNNLVKNNEFKEKLKAHQKMLQSLGYNVVINGVVDDKTAIAHDKYIQKRDKEAKKQKRRAEKELKRKKNLN